MTRKVFWLGFAALAILFLEEGLRRNRRSIRSWENSLCDHCPVKDCDSWCGI